MLCAIRDRRGAIMLETLIAFLPLLFFFVGICQVADGYAHQLIVQRAASAAVRAAVVVLPDDPIHYKNVRPHQYIGARKRAIDRAAEIILDASLTFRKSPHTIRVTGVRRPKGGDPITARVSARYTCILPLLGMFCGRRRHIQLNAEATLPYQGASYAY